ncbi:MAG: hypothetical protein H0W83_00095 [Planctomycetes bacterium]|nr:hypothetical protein [Planctomycetota bacterium]
MSVRRCLAVLPCLCALPAAAVVSVTDDSLNLSLGAQLQTRVERATSSDANGGYDTVLGRPGSSDVADFSIRRARLLIGGTYQAVYRFGLSYTSESVDAQGYQTSRGASAYKAWIEREFYGTGVIHVAHAGLDYPFYNRAVGGDAFHLFPQQRATAALLPVRGVGARYKLIGDRFDFGIDVQNTLDPAKPAANADKADGLFWSGRLEMSLLDGRKPEYRESYVGEARESALLALDIGYDQADYGTPLFRTNTLCYGIEALVHDGGLSGLAELRWLRSRAASTIGAGDVDTHQHVYLVQFGYAVPLDDGMVLEPAARLSLLRFDTPGDEVYDTTANPDSEWGGSGRQIDLGLNLYLNRHSNKIQLSYSRWTAESGDGKADIVRLQHQFFF